MWNFEELNLIVQLVEKSSDDLQGVVTRLGPGAPNDREARRFYRLLRRTVKELDMRAIELLACYDPAARAMLAEGITYDKRRDLFKAPRPVDVEALKRVGRGTAAKT